MSGPPDETAIGRALDRLKMHVAEQTEADAAPLRIYLPVPRNGIERAATERLLDLIEARHPQSVLIYTEDGQPGAAP